MKEHQLLIIIVEIKGKLTPFLDSLQPSKIKRKTIQDKSEKKSIKFDSNWTAGFGAADR